VPELPLYTTPPHRQPLTIDKCEGNILDLLPDILDMPQRLMWGFMTAFMEGVRYAEKAHNIGGDK
jgi:hypothetical protein